MNTVIAPIGETAPVDDAALPLEWAQWAEEPGKVIQIEENGAVVGRVHAIVVGRSEAWVEGLWVTPSRRRAGVGRQLLKAAEDLVRGYGVGTIRAAVPGHNTIARAVAERTGCAPIAPAVVGVVTASRSDAGPDGRPVSREPAVRRAAAVEAPAVGALVASSLKPWRELVPIGWRFRRIGVDLIRGLARDGRVLVTQDPGGVAIVALGPGTAVLSALAGSTAQRQSLLDTVMSQAHAARIAVFAPDLATVSDLDIALEPHAWCPEGLVLVEKSLVR